MIESTVTFNVSIERLGMVMSPNGDPAEREGVLNPASARSRVGQLILYPRAVAHGNISRVGRVFVREKNDGFELDRDGFALEPSAPYELRPNPGYGCEDPRVTFLPILDRYAMSYTAFGTAGPRVAFALSQDGLDWERVGLAEFTQPGMPMGDDKDAAFFPEPVLSPNGVKSLAFYHRPMLHISAVDGRAAVPMIERLPFADRESIRIGYIPLEPVLRDRQRILDVAESVLVLSPNADWGSIKIGGGTPPVRIAEGWMSLYHAVDLLDNRGTRPKFCYSAGMVVHDYEQPHRVLYRSPKPILTPTSTAELSGIVDNVVFPTGLDPRPDLGERVFDIYYGMADYSIGAVRMTLQ